METLAKLEELEQKFGENPRRYFAALANEYRKNGEFEQAIELCRAQLEQQPEHLSGRVVLGQALFDAFRYAEARQELTTALQLDPENFIALRLLGELAAQDGDQDIAREFFSRARDIEPRNEQLLAALAALGPAEPPPTLAEAVARSATTAAEPIAEPAVERFAAEPIAEPTVERFTAEPVAEPAPVGGVERFAESALGPSAKGAPVGGAPVGGAAALPRAEAVAQPEPALAAQAVTESVAQPVPEPVTEGPVRRERPAKPARKRKTPVHRVEGLITTTLEPEQPKEAPPAARTEIETQAVTTETRVSAQAVEAERIEPQTGAAVVERETPAAETETPPEARAAIVTETMADLYLEQGHRAEAVEVLRQLVSQRPEDERLSRRLADLEITPVVSTVRDFFARFAARGGVAHERAAAGPREQTTGSLSGMFGESGSTLLDPESAALIAVTLPEPTATPTADEFENWVGRRRKP